MPVGPSGRSSSKADHSELLGGGSSSNNHAGTMSGVSEPSSFTLPLNSMTEHSELLGGSSSNNYAGIMPVISEPSSFALPLHSITWIISDDMRFVARDVTTRFTVDGAVCDVGAAKIEFESDIGGRAEASDVQISTAPVVKVEIGCIEELRITDVFLLSTPIRRPEITYDGATLKVRLDSIDAELYDNEGSGGVENSGGVFLSVPELPCNFSLGIEKVMQIKLLDGTTTKFGEFHLHAKKGESFTKVAIHSESVDTDLVSLSKVDVRGLLPLNQVNTIEGFTYTGGGIKILNDFTKTGGFDDSEKKGAPEARHDKKNGELGERECPSDKRVAKVVQRAGTFN